MVIARSLAAAVCCGFFLSIACFGASAQPRRRVRLAERFVTLRFRQVIAQMIVQQDGKFTLTKVVEDVKFYYSNISEPNPPELKPGVDFLRYLSETISPPRIAGTYILVHEKAGFGTEGRAAWLYAPALKRIRRAPAGDQNHPHRERNLHRTMDPHPLLLLPALDLRNQRNRMQTNTHPHP